MKLCSLFVLWRPCAGPFTLSAVVAVIGLITSSSLPAQPWEPVEPPRYAPPPSPPIESRQSGGIQPKTNGVPGTLWSIGQPTDEEQLYLEYINRSRANPPAEGARLATTTDPDVLSEYAAWKVNLGLMQSQFNAIPAVPPLAMHGQLVNAARLHSGDMFTNQFQGHVGSNGSNTSQRITAAGYNWQMNAENVFAYARSPWHGHAGFNVDWGGSTNTGGMQSPPGHRNNIHNAGLREVGVGIYNGVNGSVGPQIVTQDFGSRFNITPMICGVAYYDLNGNGFYDLGEGIGGVTVTSPGSTYYAVTADSGGYTLPVSSNGNYTVSFTTAGLNSNRTATVANNNNVKVDYVPTYSPPVISGPNPAAVNQTNNYIISLVGAATGYDWQRATLSNYTAVEGAESGLANVTVVTSGGYAIQDSTYKASGSYSFHLTHPNGTDEIITLNPVLRLSAGSQLAFSKRLGYATVNQIARAQISTDSGATWVSLWSQAGVTGSPGDTQFLRVTNSLAAYSGKSAQIRFVYDVTGGYYYDTGPGMGLYLDDISVSGAQQLGSIVTTSLATNTFAFAPASSGGYLLRARARINSRSLPYGPDLVVNAVVPPPSIQALRPVVAGSQAQIEFTVANFVTGMTFQVWKSSSAAGPFVVDAGATVQTIIANSRFRATTGTGGAAAQYYRIRGAY